MIPAEPLSIMLMHDDKLPKGVQAHTPCRPHISPQCVVQTYVGSALQRKRYDE